MYGLEVSHRQFHPHQQLSSHLPMLPRGNPQPAGGAGAGTSKPPKSTLSSAPGSSRKSIGGSGNVTSPASAGFMAAVSPVSTSKASPTTRISQQAILAAEAMRNESAGDSDDDFESGHRDDKRLAPSVMGFGRRKDHENVPADIPELADDVKVDVHVRCVPLVVPLLPCAHACLPGCGHVFMFDICVRVRLRVTCESVCGRCRPMSADELKSGDKVVLKVRAQHHHTDANTHTCKDTHAHFADNRR